jgi:T-complex protein 1 subunit alpha
MHCCRGVAGGGAVEAALSIHLEAFATTLGSREQLAIAEAADALLVIPKTLAVNAAKDATELARTPPSPLSFCAAHAPVQSRQSSMLPLLGATSRKPLSRALKSEHESR